MTDFLPPALLAAFRLIQVLFITIYHVAGVIFASLVRGWDGKRVARQASDWAADLVKKLDIHIALEGRLPEQGVMVVSNHRSYLDIVVILTHIQSAFLAKVELKKWPVFGYAAVKGNTVFVDRSSRKSRKGSRKKILDRLNQGISVVVFPEGTTFEGPGLLAFKNGIFHTVFEKDIPIVPVAVCYEDKDAAWVGDDTFIPHFFRTFRKRRLKTHMSVGPVTRETSPENLKHACHDYIAKTLAQKEGHPKEPAAARAHDLPN